MAYNESLAERIRAKLKQAPDFSEKKMFGGLSFLYKNKMTVGIIKEDLIVRIPAENRYLLFLEEYPDIAQRVPQ